MYLPTHEADIEFSLIRILGNSLPPRHAPDEMLRHLQFTLQHESNFDNCEKGWILNRITDSRLATRCANLIREAGHQVFQFHFDLEEYATHFNDLSGVSPGLLSERALGDAATYTTSTFALEWKYRYKSLYAIGLNKMRNVALNLGRARARWTLPWDGACFITDQAWREILELTERDSLYAIVPLSRVTDTQTLLSPDYRPDSFTEPQIMFRNDSRETFDEMLRYGNRNKAELLVRLGAPGPWNNWRPASWDRQAVHFSAERDRFVQGAWVARLPAGCDARIEESDLIRWRTRFVGVAALCQQLDARVVAKHNKPGRLLCYNESALGNASEEIIENLVTQSKAAMERPVLTILNKKGCAPSGDPQDYFSLAPYFHVEKDQRIIHKDGVRIAATTLGTAESSGNDRAVLEQMIYDVCVTTLTGYVAGRDTAYEHAATLIRAWFVDEATRMNPNMRFAQCLPGSNKGQAWGVVEFRNCWPLLDAITLLRRAQVLTGVEFDSINSWFAEFLDDLTSHQGGKANNNIAVWHDLIAASIAAFLGRHSQAAQILADVPIRISSQLSAFSVPHSEIQRTRPLHYGLFLTQGLVYLCWLGRRLGMDLWQYKASMSRSVAMLIRFLALNKAMLPDYEEDASTFDVRLAHIIKLVPEGCADYPAVGELNIDNEEVFDEPIGFKNFHFGIAPLFLEFGQGEAD